MKTIEELTNEVIEYEYELRPYEMKDCYNSKEEAYEDIYKILSVKPKGILNEIVEEKVGTIENKIPAKNQKTNNYKKKTNNKKK